MRERLVRYRDRVPRGAVENARWRRWAKELKDSAQQQAMWTACSRDIVFFVAGFCWIFEPRNVKDRQNKVLPFVPWECQEQVLDAVVEAAGCAAGVDPHDCLIEKSRDMGATWICIAAFLWLWMFRPNMALAMISRKQELVDKGKSRDTLFGKLDFMIARLPNWMRPRLKRQSLQLTNLDNGSELEGAATTGDATASGRKVAILLDEFALVPPADQTSMLAATADTAPCRIFNSTPKGAGTAFHLLATSNIRKLNLHWSKHPEKARGLYHDENGKPRSPWYDAECKRRKSALEVAQNLDIAYTAPGSCFFDTDLVEAHIAKHGCVPERILQGSDLLALLGKFVPGLAPEGELSLWLTEPNEGHNYALGVDVAAGTGIKSSASCISVGSVNTGEKIAEYVSRNDQPHMLARVAKALGMWFRGPDGQALICHEGNGPCGQMFGRTMTGELGYGNLFFKRSEFNLRQRVSDLPGWHSTPEAKEAMLGSYREALFSDRVVNHSIPALKELFDYVHLPSGSVGVPGLMVDQDAADHPTKHGDMVIADGLMLKAITEWDAGRLAHDEISMATFYGRFMKVKNAKLAVGAY